MKIFRILITISLIINFSQISYTQTPIDEYLIIAAKSNPLLKAKFNQYLAAMEKVPQVGTLPDPQLTFGYFISTPETRVGAQQWNVSLMQKFPWFGLLNAQKDAATLFAKAKFEEFNQAKSELFYNVKETYYKYYFINKAINITAENLKILETIKQLAAIKVEAGIVSLADVLRIEMEINELENQLALLQDKKNDLQVKFNNLLDTNITLTIPDSMQAINQTLNESVLLDSIWQNNYMLKSIDMRMQAFAVSETVASKKGKPTIALGVGYTNVANRADISMPDNGKDILMFPTVSVSIPLYRNKYKAMINEAKLNFRAQENQWQNTKNTIHTVFEKNTTEYADAERRILLYHKQRILAQKALDILIVSYSTDNKDFDEVLRMERLLLKYQLEEEKALIDKNIAIAFTDYLLGK
jgi:outer membrane protein TolC